MVTRTLFLVHTIKGILKLLYPMTTMNFLIRNFLFQRIKAYFSEKFLRFWKLGFSSYLS